MLDGVPRTLQERIASRMAADGLSVWDVAERAGVDPEDIRSVLVGRLQLVTGLAEHRLGAWLGIDGSNRTDQRPA